MLPLSDLDPAVAAMFTAREYDVNLMTLAELNMLAEDLRRFTV